MKTFILISISLFIAYYGFNKITDIKKSVVQLDEICRFVLFVKEEIRSKKTPVNELMLKFNSLNYKYIEWNEKNVCLTGFCSENTKALFYDFCSSVGTSDVFGQISLCEEYGEKFKKLKYDEEKDISSKVKTYAAFTALFCVCTLVFI